MICERPPSISPQTRPLVEDAWGALDRQLVLAGLREAEERVSLAADSAEAGLWTLAAATGVFWVSNRTRLMFGFTPDEVIDLARFQAAVHPNDWEAVRDGIEQAFRGQAPVDVEYRMFRATDQRMRWIAARGQLQFHGAGEPPRLMGFCIDVTQRKRADELVRINEARLASATELARLGFYEIDFEEGTAFFDDRLQEVLGIPPDRKERLGPLEFWVERLHADDRRPVLEQRTRLHDGTVERLEAEYRFLHPTQGERWLHHVGRVTKRDVAGRALMSNGVLRDITERRRDEEALRRSYAQIKELKDRLQAESDYLKAEIGAGRLHGEIAGQSPAILHVLRQVEQVAATDATVLVLGETGTGKERIAQAIHRLSPRHQHVMVKVNCAALPAGLVESELFGREKGAFTGALTRQVGRFEIADGSTLFLDEIGELSLDLQSKLLRVIESGEFERLGSPKTIRVNVRLIAATNRDLVAAIKEGRFREDLYYRLNVFPIRVPPLRERREDIPSLVWTLLSELNARMGKKITQVPRETMDALLRHAWPGNVRELRNVLEHAAIVTSGMTLCVGALEDRASDADAGRALAGIERAHILAVLEESGWRVKGPDGAAAILGLKPSTLRGRMAKLGIDRPSPVKPSRD